MSEEEIKKLADFIQDRIHMTYLPGFYFDVEDVEDIIKEYYGKQES
jgi:hypothetical protein